MAENELYNEATQHLKNGDYKSAATSYRAALALEPDRANLHAALGACLIRLDSTNEAIAAYETALSIDPTEAKFYAGLGQSALRAGEFKRACDAFLAAIRLKSDIASWHKGLGRSLMKLDSPAAAQTAYRAALALTPGEAALHVASGRASMAAGDLTSAQEAFRAALVLDPSGASAHIGLASIAERQEDQERAVFHRRHAVTLQPEQAAWHVALARQLIQVGRTGEAMNGLRAALELQPLNADWKAMLQELETWGNSETWTERDVSAAYYDSIYASSEKYALDAEDSIYYPIWERIRALVLSRKAKTVLDVGCGPGQFAKMLCRETDINYYGFDFSKVAIEKAKAKGIANAMFDQEDARQTDVFERDRPDAIICTEVLEHVAHDLELIDRFNSGVFCICSVPSFYSFSHLRYFIDSDQVQRRYGALFKALTVETFSMPGTEHQIYLFYGERVE